MPKIQISKDKKTGQEKHWLYLPREIMLDKAVRKGDSLNFIRVLGNEITFELKRAVK